LPGPLAQSVEQRTFNPWVVGSIPTGPTLLNGLLNMRSCANLFLTNFRVKSKNRVNGNSQHLLIKSLEDAKNRALVRG
jgi:hypothetical protein